MEGEGGDIKPIQCGRMNAPILVNKHIFKLNDFSNTSKGGGVYMVQYAIIQHFDQKVQATIFKAKHLMSL